MAKFANNPVAPATPKPAPRVKTPIKTKSAPTTTTALGAPGYERGKKSELFLLAISNMVGQDTFHENAEDRDSRYATLIHAVTKKDPEWVARFLPWLRSAGLMRTASLVGAVEYIRAGGPNGAQVVKAVLQRADEPAEMLSYYLQTNNGKRAIANQLRDGISAAIQGGLYNEFSCLRYDSSNNAMRMGDVIELCHVTPASTQQSMLFRYLIDIRHNRPDAGERSFRDKYGLPLITVRRTLNLMPEGKRRGLLTSGSEVLFSARFDWEHLSGWLPGGMDGAAWDFVIPSMGYMALLRNLRNFDQAGISDASFQHVVTKLTDPAEVAKSKQFPIRFLSAYKNVSNVRWHYPLEVALGLSVGNIPALTGSTLILIDVSGSMCSPYSNRGARGTWTDRANSPELWEVAGIFGVSLALRSLGVGGTPDIVAFSTSYSPVTLSRGSSVLNQMAAIRRVPAFNGGTNIPGAIKYGYKNHDRVVILTDEQSHYGMNSHGGIPPTKPVFVFNIAGYRAAGLSADNVYTFGGLTDAGFKTIELVENLRDGTWPF